MVLPIATEVLIPENDSVRLLSQLLGEYESEENYVYIKNQGYVPYIKPQNHEQMKKKSRKNRHIGKAEYMRYDPEHDTYECKAGKLLKAVGVAKRKSKSGYEAQLTRYECENCEGCMLKDKCTKSKWNKQMSISRSFINLSAESAANITTAQGKFLNLRQLLSDRFYIFCT